jgi:hypothetical protein
MAQLGMPPAAENVAEKRRRAAGLAWGEEANKKRRETFAKTIGEEGQREGEGGDEGADHPEEMLVRCFWKDPPRLDALGALRPLNAAFNSWYSLAEQVQRRAASR